MTGLKESQQLEQLVQTLNQRVQEGTKILQQIKKKEQEIDWKKVFILADQDKERQKEIAEWETRKRVKRILLFTPPFLSFYEKNKLKTNSI